MPADSDYRTGFLTLGTDREGWHARVASALTPRIAATARRRRSTRPPGVSSAARPAARAPGGVWQARASGGSQDYFQTFTAVATGRASERLTTEQWMPSDFVQCERPVVAQLRRARRCSSAPRRYRTESTVDEFRYTHNQRAAGPFSGRRQRERRRRLRTRGHRGARSRHGRDSARASTAGGRSPPILRCRVAVHRRSSARARRSPGGAGDIALQGSVYRAHRTPTLNELHRGFRAGNVVTNPNPLLKPETLTGVEGGALYANGPLSARARPRSGTHSTARSPTSP